MDFFANIKSPLLRNYNRFQYLKSLYIKQTDEEIEKNYLSLISDEDKRIIAVIAINYNKMGETEFVRKFIQPLTEKTTDY